MSEAAVAAVAAAATIARQEGTPKLRRQQKCSHHLCLKGLLALPT